MDRCTITTVAELILHTQLQFFIRPCISPWNSFQNWSLRNLATYRFFYKHNHTMRISIGRLDCLAWNWGVRKRGQFINQERRTSRDRIQACISTLKVERQAYAFECFQFRYLFPSVCYPFRQLFSSALHFHSSRANANHDLPDLALDWSGWFDQSSSSLLLPVHVVSSLSSRLVHGGFSSVLSHGSTGVRRRGRHTDRRHADLDWLADRLGQFQV